LFVQPDVTRVHQKLATHATHAYTHTQQHTHTHTQAHTKRPCLHQKMSRVVEYEWWSMTG